MQWSAIKDILVTQRQDKDEIYKNTLAKQQKFAGDVHDAELGLSNGDQDKSLQTIRDQRAKHKTLHQAIADGEEEQRQCCLRAICSCTMRPPWKIMARYQTRTAIRPTMVAAGANPTRPDGR